jgi:hypothetical protein
MKLEKALHKIAYEDDTNKFMSNENITFINVCSDEAEHLYVYLLKSDDCWLPTLAVPDRTAPSSKFGANLAVTRGKSNVESGVLSNLVLPFCPSSSQRPLPLQPRLREIVTSARLLTIGPTIVLTRNHPQAWIIAPRGVRSALLRILKAMLELKIQLMGTRESHRRHPRLRMLWSTLVVASSGFNTTASPI